MKVYPANGDRTIITADYLLDKFGSFLLDNPTIFFYIITPFMLPPEHAETYFARRMEDLLNGPDGAGKNGAVEAVLHLCNAYEKMSVFEREAVRKDLPNKIAEVTQKGVPLKVIAGIIEGMAGLKDWAEEKP